MPLKHPEYAHGISDEDLIKEAIEFCNEELDSFNGMEYDDDSEVCCQRSNTFIRELVVRLTAALARPAQEPVAGIWHEGEPPHPWKQEWFIAETTYGDRVVLKSLPEDFTYDYKTADETYIKADRIKRWMQFPDSVYLAAPQPVINPTHSQGAGTPGLLTDPAPADLVEPFQARVQPWMMACFGATIAGDREERNHRFLEEALELVQSTGCTAHEAHQLVDYVYGRDTGEPPQEVGGVMVTLAALCLANDLDMHLCGETELARIWTKVEAIRAKQAAKPKHSPLPGPSASEGSTDQALHRAATAGLGIIAQPIRLTGEAE
jgi:hypothetical protein